MLFEKRFHHGLRDGSVTVTFRKWSSPQAKEGGRYRTSAGTLVVDELRQVSLTEIGNRDAARAGFVDRGSLIEYLEKKAKGRLGTDASVYRVAFHLTQDAFEESSALDDGLTKREYEELSSRLAKMDTLSRHGPWTREVLALIAANPRVPASRLAAKAGRDTQPFKADVRKLKRLGLTLSFEIGYELSPRGRALVEKV